LLLSKPDILACLREGKLRFDPPITEDRVVQVSIDLKLGRKFSHTRLSACTFHRISPGSSKEEVVGHALVSRSTSREAADTEYLIL